MVIFHLLLSVPNFIVDYERVCGFAFKVAKITTMTDLVQKWNGEIVKKKKSIYNSEKQTSISKFINKAKERMQ